MNVGKGYDNAQAYEGGAFPKITPGGHICRIMNASVAKAKTGREMLNAAFDIEEGSELDGYYAKSYDNRRKFAGNGDLKWPGVYSVTITDNDGNTSGYLKGLINAVEQSNPPYNFKSTNFDEKTLAKKLVGLVFGPEEYEKQQSGEIVVIVKPQYAVSVQRVKDGIEPPPLKKIKRNNQYGAPQSYGAPQTASAPAYTEVDDGDLPF